MLLTKDQKLLLEILDQFGCLREDQIEFLLLLKLPFAHLSHALKFPSDYGLIRNFQGVVSLPNKGFDVKTVDAVDVMIDIAKKSLVCYQKGTEPFLLTFFKERDGKIWRYDICSVVFGTENVVNAALEAVGPKYRKIIFMIDREEQIPALSVRCEFCFALKRDNQFHYFKE